MSNFTLNAYKIIVKYNIVRFEEVCKCFGEHKMIRTNVPEDRIHILQHLSLHLNLEAFGGPLKKSQLHT